jgi:FAD/FMN-containing dehydrogenase
MSATHTPSPRRGKPERSVADKLVLPDDPRWQQARRAWNLAVEQQPAAVGLPESVDDVIAMIAYSAERGLRVAPQSTGHAAGALDDLSRTLLLRTSSMRGARVDPDARTAQVHAGTTWAEVTAAAAPHGLAALAASAADVGVLGYTLAGGVSWLSRRYGLASNSVTAAEVVTAHGAHIRTDSRHEPDLFWALRGGGGNFGVVTALEFTLYPLRDAYAGALFWPLERAHEILEALEPVDRERARRGHLDRTPAAAA